MTLSRRLIRLPDDADHYTAKIVSVHLFAVFVASSGGQLLKHTRFLQMAPLVFSEQRESKTRYQEAAG